jgi:4-aminobutyrate aminotransferase-like enzyme
MHTTPPKTRGKMVNSFDPSEVSGLSVTTRAHIDRRAKLLGPAYRLFYKNPVEVCRGSGVFLYDRDGLEYLDAYNNVVSVGHAHPRVIEAVSSQMATLCTHTRYIQEGILTYAAELLETFTGRIGDSGHAMFTCTGSEANDLAIRIAEHHTGNRGVIVTSEAYHGNSHRTAEFSPSLGTNSPLGQWVRTVPAPDSYRIPEQELPQWFANQVSLQIADLKRHGQGVAAIIADSLFSSDGIYTEPTTLLGPTVDIVRQEGGVFIADEVQCGFGRTGDAFWGYQRHGVDPDIVTMGKPMGNGFPVAGITVAPEVVASFGTDIRYFNTFGGNTVAMAAAKATLDVIRDERLMQNACGVGVVLKRGLQELAERYDWIGDVRGTGLYLGVEIVQDRRTKAPAAARATAIVNGLRERRVLISATGFNANTLKIRPPLVFTMDNAGRLLEQLENVLKTV